MAKSIILNMQDFPHMQRLIRSQNVTITLRGRVIGKKGNEIGFDIDEAKVDAGKMSTHEILHSINETFNMTNTATG